MVAPVSGDRCPQDPVHTPPARSGPAGLFSSVAVGHPLLHPTPVFSLLVSGSQGCAVAPWPSLYTDAPRCTAPCPGGSFGPAHLVFVFWGSFPLTPPQGRRGPGGLLSRGGCRPGPSTLSLVLGEAGPHLLQPGHRLCSPGGLQALAPQPGFFPPGPRGQFRLPVYQDAGSQHLLGGPAAGCHDFGSWGRRGGRSSVPVGTGVDTGRCGPACRLESCVCGAACTWSPPRGAGASPGHREGPPRTVLPADAPSEACKGLMKTISFCSWLSGAVPMV